MGPRGQLALEAVQSLIDEIRAFAKAREWERFHSPKNLAMALSVEVAEIVEIMQWMSEAESRAVTPKQLERLREEIGDVQILLANLADKLGIDPLEAAKKKLRVNEEKYPAEKVRGKALKYSEYPEGDP